jgi:hypothetical protein
MGRVRPLLVVPACLLADQTCCLFASGHYGPTVDTFEPAQCSLVCVLSVV